MAATPQQPTLQEVPRQGVAVVDREPAPLAVQPSDEHIVAMFERLAKDPSVDVEKLERLIAMQERIMRHQAKAEFDAAFAQMQGEIPEISEKGQILVNGELRSKYATNEDIQREIKPILKAHGFSIRFRNEWLDANKLKVIGILSHRSGHSEQDEFVAAADTSGSKNAIQALGSTRSYGQRYTTIALLNIATRGTDDDGAKSEHYKAPAAPDGYDDWMADMASCSDEGLSKLTGAWNKSKKEYRDYAARHDRDKWEALKAKAQKVGAR